MLQTFDAPNGDFACVRRAPLEHAAAGACDLQRADLPRMRAGAAHCGRSSEGGSRDADRLVYAFRRCLARDAQRRREVDACSSFCTSKRAGSRRRAPTRGTWPPASPEDAPAASRRRQAAGLAGWTVVARVLLNLDETITKE